MHKHLLIGILALVALILTGCTDKTKEVKEFHSDTFDITVLSADWEFDNKTMQFYYHCYLDEISSEVYNYGNWTLSREFDGGSKNAYQVALPMSTFMTDTLPNKSVYYYTEYLDYRVGVGYVEIQVTNSDYFYPKDAKGKLIKPDNMYFRMQVMY